MKWCGRRRRIIFFTLRFCLVTLAAGAVVMLVREGSVGTTQDIYPFMNIALGDSKQTTKGTLSPVGLGTPLKYITAVYRAMRADHTEDLYYPIIKKLLEQKLSKHGYRLTMFVSSRGCSKGQWDVQQAVDVFIIGGGPVLSSQNLCILPLLNKPTVILLAGSGYNDDGLHLKEYNALRAYRGGDDSVLIGKDRSTRNTLLDLLQHTVVGGVRGLLTKRVVDYGLKELNISVLGDILTTTSTYTKDSKFEDRDLGLPKGEKYVLINLCRNTTKGYGGGSGKVIRELHLALITLNHRYHIVTYGLTKEDMPSVAHFTDSLKKAAENPDNKIIQLTQPPSLPTLGRLIKQAFLTINCAAEANYLSISYETPFVGVAQRFETLELLEQLSMTNSYGVLVQKVKASTIVFRVNQAAHDEEKLRKRMRKYNKEVIKNYDKLFESLAKNLTSTKFRNQRQ